MSISNCGKTRRRESPVYASISPPHPSTERNPIDVVTGEVLDDLDDNTPHLSDSDRRALARHAERVDSKAFIRSTQAEYQRLSASYGRGRDHFDDVLDSANRPSHKRLSWLVLIGTSGFALLILIILAAIYASELRDNTARLMASVRAQFESRADQKTDVTNNSATVETPAVKTSNPTSVAADAQNAQAKAAQPNLQTQAAQAPQNPAAGLKASGPQPAGTSALAQSLFQLGALSCIARANQISNFLSNGTEAVVVQKPIGTPDKSLLMATFLPSTQSESQTISILSLAPNIEGGCDGNYQSIRVVDKSCGTAINENYGADRAIKIKETGVLVVTINTLSRVFAIPTGTQCLLIGQESTQ